MGDMLRIWRLARECVKLILSMYLPFPSFSLVPCLWQGTHSEGSASSHK